MMTITDGLGNQRWLDAQGNELSQDVVDEIVGNHKRLRDYFAAAALQGMLSGDLDNLPSSVEGVVESSYIYADAMLRAREDK